MPLKDKIKLKEYNHKKYVRNRERILSYCKEYYTKNKDRICDRTRKWFRAGRYGLSYTQYLELVELQKNCCALCGLPESRKNQRNEIKPLSVDHDHRTGKVRGLLCNDCNAMLGFAHEDIERLSNAIIYITKFK